MLGWLKRRWRGTPMFKRFEQSVARQPAGRGKKTSSPQYHAVSIILPSSACDAAKLLVGTRFLAAQAPVFPVDGCDGASCSCKYQHHDDRREGLRRAEEIGLPSQPPTDEERRTSLDRRAEDQGNNAEPRSVGVDYFSYLTKG